MPNVLSPRDLVSRPDNMDKTVLSSKKFPSSADSRRASCQLLAKKNGHLILINCLQKACPGTVWLSS